MNGSLKFYFGTMNTGKSTLALQMHHNAQAAGKNVALLTKMDRGGQVVSSRLGLQRPALSVGDEMHVYDWYWSQAHPLDMLIVDEAQFLSAEQVDGLAHIADEAGVSVRTFGLLSDFRTHLFEGSQRLIELSDHIEPLHLETMCWCGREGVMNARVIDGRMMTEGDAVLVGDVGGGDEGEHYVVLCRAHHRDRAWRDGVGLGARGTHRHHRPADTTR